MSDRVSIAIDVMGGDLGLHAILPASIAALASKKNLFLFLCGDTAAISLYLDSNPVSKDCLARVKLVDARSVVAMDEKASYSLRHRRDSSMYIALSLVRDGVVQACVSAGNTGVLMAMSCLLIKTIDGISRPAIVASLPTMKGHCTVLDLGANINCKALNLFQFAVMGSALASGVFGVKNPKVGLLNIGSELNKGLEPVREAGEMLQAQSGINYRGCIEGDDVYAGKMDVIVCDGFAGNILLKTSEGLAKFINFKVAKNLKKSLFRRFLTWMAGSVLLEIREQLDPARRNGAVLLGLRAVVVKSHGAANQKSFENAINQAAVAIHCDLPNMIERGMKKEQAIVGSTVNQSPKN